MDPLLHQPEVPAQVGDRILETEPDYIIPAD